MNTRLVLWAMILKELRTTLRERQQLVGLLISVISMVAGAAVPAMQSGDNLRKVAAEAQHWGVIQMSAARWVLIGMGGAMGLFFTLGYVISAVVVTFAGEKESKTLELVLASPVSSTLLFVGKCIGVIMPSLLIGWSLLLVLAGAAQFFYGPVLARLPIAWAFYLLVLSVPVFALPGLFLVGIGAAVSAKAETAKGAGQVLGAVFFVVFFGGGYGLPLLVRFTRLGPPLLEVGKAWMTWPFAVQYAALLAVLAVPALLSLAMGRLLFHRDRLLT
jgi:ABC-type Na+ efflux pump permease subunit